MVGPRGGVLSYERGAPVHGDRVGKASAYACMSALLKASVGAAYITAVLWELTISRWLFFLRKARNLRSDSRQGTSSVSLSAGEKKSSFQVALYLPSWQGTSSRNVPLAVVVLNLRTTTSQKCAVVPRQARI